MKRVINLDNWNRKEHFKFFSALDDPFWGITTTVDFTSIYQQSKNMEVSFFLYSVHFLLKCINATTAFKLRIENGEVVEYDKINISPTIGREELLALDFLSMTQIFPYLLKMQKRKYIE
jgi:chloramphenicol O-acetyltransferase type A